MPSIINSDSGATSGSAGFKFAAADDGILEIQNSGNTAISISPEGIATFAQPPLTAIPTFSINRSSSAQNITSGVATKVQLNNIVFDSNNYWDSQNHRYTPQIAGYYYFFGTVYIQGLSVTGIEAFIYKNGSVLSLGPYIISGSTSDLITASVQVVSYMNGTSDYVELYGLSNGTNPTFLNSPATFFSGFLVRAA